MRIFAVKDDDLNGKTVAYLLYYEMPKTFYIELPEDADEWETPLLLSSFAKKGEHTINSYWSMEWVRQRIIPQDRQNIGEILKENGLAVYDEFDLLMLSMGRCAQDNCYLTEISADKLPEELVDRWKIKLEDVIPLDNGSLLCFFRNGIVKKCSLTEYTNEIPQLNGILARFDIFRKVEVQTDGYGVLWNGTIMISNSRLYESGVDVPLTLNDFVSFISNRIINASQACQLLDCSRQNIQDLVKRGKLHPIRIDNKNTMFLRNEIIQRRKG